MYKITSNAERHLMAIGAYTRTNLGVTMANEYLSALVSKFELLGSNPKMGRAREEVSEGLYSFLEGSHVIFYLLQKNYISIVGVLHQKQDCISYFNETSLNFN